MSSTTPFYEQVQAHYDVSDEFFALWLDPTMTYSCAYFERPDMPLEEAQRAKIDLSLGKCDLSPGQRLLDIGCGWGATARRAAQEWNVRVVGLTLSRNQQREAARRTADVPGIEIRLQGWEEFDEPVDRIVSIGAFEHFRKARYPAFFEKCYRLLPPGGRMLLHTILLAEPAELAHRGTTIEHEHVVFAKFIGRSIFPGGQLCTAGTVVDHARRAGFEVSRIHSLQPHYAMTLDQWAANLQSQRERAIAITSPQIYEMYMKYLTGCAAMFRSGHVDVAQFTLVKNS